MDRYDSNQEVMNPLADNNDAQPRTSGNLDDETTSLSDMQKEMNVKKEPIEIHAMPGKFVPQKQVQAKKSGSSNSRKIFLIIIILLVVVGGVIAAGIWYVLSQSNVPDEPAVIENQNINANQNTNINTNQNINKNQNVNINNNQNTNINTNQNINKNQNVNINNNQNSNSNIVTPTNLDQDQDGLTYEEEAVFSTNINLEDTDRDGYSDGQEVANLYNPLVPGETLADSGLVVKFVNYGYDYSFFKPSAWLSYVGDLGMEDVTVLPDSEVGESFNIKVMDNTEGWNLSQALTNLSATLGQAANFQNYSLDGQPALRSIDGHTVISVTPEHIYIIKHELPLSGPVYFENIFEMMLNSWQWNE